MRHGDVEVAAAVAIQLGLHVVAEHAQIPVTGAAFEQVHQRFGFGTAEHRILLRPGADRQTLGNAGVGQVDEVLEFGLVDRRREVQAFAVGVDAQFHALAALGLQVGVTDFQRAGGDVCAGGIQLFVGRCTLGAVHADAQVNGIVELPDAGRRQVGGAEGAAAVVTGRVQLDLVVAAAQFQLERAELLFLQYEQADVLRAGIRNERLFALGTEITVAELQAERAVPAADLLLHRFQARLDATVGEAGGRRAGFQLHVLVVGVGHACIDVLQERDRVVDAGLGLEAVLHHVDAHVMLVAAFLFIAMVVAVVMAMIIAIGMHVRAIGNAVVGAIGAGRYAEVAAVAQPGRADAAGAGADGAVVEAAAARFFAFFARVVMVVIVMVFKAVDHCIAGNAVVVAIAHQAVHMQHDIAADAIEAEHAAALVVHRIAAQLGAAAERALRQLAGDAAIHHIDRATDGTTAEQQRGRALQHFDLVGQERLDAGGMVGADGGGIHVAHAIGQHSHARAFLAADDRAADARAEERALHARQLGHGIAEGAGLLLVQAFAGQYLHRARQRFGIALQWRRGDLHRRQFSQVAVTLSAVIAGGKGNRRQQGGEGQSEGMRLQPRGVGGHGAGPLLQCINRWAHVSRQRDRGRKTVRVGSRCYIIP